MGKIIDEKTKNDIAYLYNMNLPPAKISEITGVSSSSVHRVLRENGIPPHNAGKQLGGQHSAEELRKNKESAELSATPVQPVSTSLPEDQMQSLLSKMSEISEYLREILELLK